MEHTFPILTITGSDSTGGSGVQADIKTISALGGYAVSAITSITVQTTLGIQQFYDLPADIVGGQIEAILNDMQPQIVKIGMIRRVDVLRTLVDTLLKYRPAHIIFDPIVRSARGDQLMTADVIAQIRRRLLPICSLVMIREQDAAVLFQQEIRNDDDRQVLVDSLRKLGCREVLLTRELDTHGLGNSFSSAVAYYMSKGADMMQAISQARAYVNQQQAYSGGSTAITGRSAQLYHEFLNAVAHHYHTNNDVAFYADCLNVSGRYLAQVTRRISGKAPKTLIDDYLIEEIERQLTTTTKTVQEIAYDFGFSSQAHFAKFFKKQQGMTPSEYRREKGKVELSNRNIK